MEEQNRSKKVGIIVAVILVILLIAGGVTWYVIANMDKNTPEELSEKIMDIKLLNKEKYIEYCKNAKKGALEFDFKELTNKLINIIEGIKQNEN